MQGIENCQETLPGHAENVLHPLREQAIDDELASGTRGCIRHGHSQFFTLCILGVLRYRGSGAKAAGTISLFSCAIRLPASALSAR